MRAMWRQWAMAFVALALLNFGLTFDSLWPTLWIRPRSDLSIELAAVVLALALAAARFGPPPRRLLAGLAMAFTVLALGRYLEVTARELYGRPINLHYDVPHVPRVIAMFAEAAPLWLTLATFTGVAVGLVALYALAHWAWARVGAALAAPAARRAIALAAAGVCVAYPFASGGFAAPVSGSFARQGVLLAQALTGTGPDLGVSPDFGGGLERVQGADVFVVFVESYGAATYDRPALAPRVAAGRAALADAAAATGRAIASAFVESPTFGGASWLAHASLLAGVEVRGGDTYNLLTTQRRDTLVHAFARAGYRTVALMPGLRQDWREGVALYGFDAVYDAGTARLPRSRLRLVAHPRPVRARQARPRGGRALGASAALRVLPHDHEPRAVPAHAAVSARLGATAVGRTVRRVGRAGAAGRAGGMAGPRPGVRRRHRLRAHRTRRLPARAARRGFRPGHLGRSPASGGRGR